MKVERVRLVRPLPAIARKMRRAPSQLDDAIARFERNLRQLVVAMVLVELEHLRAVPLALPGARSRSHPAPAASSARSSVRNKRAAAAVARTATRSTTAAAAAPVVPVAEPVDGDAATASTAPGCSHRSTDPGGVGCSALLGMVRARGGAERASIVPRARAGGKPWVGASCREARASRSDQQQGSKDFATLLSHCAARWPPSRDEYTRILPYTPPYVPGQQFREASAPLAA
jgi:hypothetical protein